MGNDAAPQPPVANGPPANAGTALPTPAPGQSASTAQPSSTSAPPVVGEKNVAPGSSATEQPASISLRYPEGVKPEDVAAFLPVAAELKLDSAGAQKVLNTFLQLNIDRQQAERQSWVEAVKADKELGGAKLEATKAVASKAWGKFGNPELKAALDSSGLGDHPAMIRLFVQLGKALSEDSVAGSSSPGPNAVDAEQARLRAFFPTMFKE